MLGDNVLGEQVDDRCRHAAELTKRWNDRAARGGIGSLTEGYLHGEIELDARACINGRQWRARVRLLVPEKGYRSDIAIPSNTETRRCGADQYWLSVLPLLAEPVKGVELVVPSLVRFEIMDDGSLFGREPFDFLLRPLFKETLRGIGNGEIAVTGFYGPVLLCESRDEEIEAVTLRGQNGADVHCDHLRDGFGRLQVHEYARTLRIRLSDDAIRLSFAKEPNFRIEDCELIIRPIEFSSWSGEIGFAHG